MNRCDRCASSLASFAFSHYFTCNDCHKNFCKYCIDDLHLKEDCIICNGRWIRKDVLAKDIFLQYIEQTGSIERVREMVFEWLIHSNITRDEMLEAAGRKHLNVELE